MNRYITFTPQAKEIIEESFIMANELYPANYDNVLVMAGNFSGYGKYVANYCTDTQLIQIPINPTFGMATRSREGFDVVDKEYFQGVMVHECAHHYVSTVGFPGKPFLDAGTSTHSNSSWCYVCGIGWEIDPETLARGVKLKVAGLVKAMARFNPYNRPTDILNSIPDAVEHFCEECGDQYTPKRIGGRFCSNKCRQKDYRRNKAA